MSDINVENQLRLANTELNKQIAMLEEKLLEKDRTMETLRESEEKYRNVVERANDGIAIIQDNIVKYLNPGTAEIWGGSIEDIIDTPFTDYIYPDELPKVAERYKLRMAGKDILPIYETIVMHKDGNKIYTELNAGIITYQGRPADLVIIRDITARKQTEEALRESEEKYLDLFENANDSIFTMSLDGSFTSFNHQAAELHGYTKEEFGHLTIGDVLTPESYAFAMQMTQKAVIEKSDLKELQPWEFKMLKHDGTVFITECRTRLLWDKDQIVGVHGIVRDITERKRMEEELLRVQKLESVGLLAGGIAHDFNNILTTILGNVSLAKMQVRPEDEIFDLLSETETASARAQTLTKQLLTFAKGGAPVKEIASIKDILKESSLFVLRGSKSRCEFSIAEDLWPAEVDVGQISQVINNIVINANQAMPEGGIIQVVAENLIIDDGHGLPLKPGRYIRISITDQGVGIAEKHLLKIFDPYFTTKQKGSGLGLATTYSIIKNHDGHITVESTLGEGTTFYIYLSASEKAVPEKEGIRLITGHGKILVMDDEESLRKIVERMLKNLGYESEFAKDGAEAIEMYKAARKSGKPYDAVILDLTIPGGMGGKEAINKFLEIDPEVKAIVSSGYSDDPVLSNFQEYGFKGMMPKPFKSLSLSKVLHEVIQGEKLNIED